MGLGDQHGDLFGVATDRMSPVFRWDATFVIWW
jgi:hypothetical protein